MSLRVIFQSHNILNGHRNIIYQKNEAWFRVHRKEKQNGNNLKNFADQEKEEKMIKNSQDF